MAMKQNRPRPQLKESAEKSIQQAEQTKLPRRKVSAEDSFHGER
jgi:hypothetical protein